MKPLTQNDQKFIEHIKIHCKELGIKCDIRDVSYVNYGKGFKCGGWFDSEGRELVVAMNSPDGFSTLVHEYGHLTQWVDDIPLWKTSSESLMKMNDWLSGVEVENIDEHLSICRDLELENEKRSVKLIKKWGLSIDVEDYTRKANAYVMFYNWMKQTRRWSKPKNSPYRNERVLSVMSSKFNMNYKKMSKKIFKIFSEENI